MDFNTNNEQNKYIIQLFRGLISKDPNVIDEISATYQNTPTLLTRRLEFHCRCIFDFENTNCACQLDHELFTYVSEDRVDIEKFENILASLEAGECCHHGDIHDEGEEAVGPRPTSVQLIHAAAVMGCIPALETLLKLSEKEPTFDDTIDSLNASPLHLAILFKQRQSIETILESGRDKLEAYYSCSFSYARRNTINPTVINSACMSVMKLCMLLNDFTTAQSILQQGSLHAAWIIDALTCDSEKFKNLILSHVSDPFLIQGSDHEVEMIIRLAIKYGDIYLVTKFLERGKTKKCSNTTFVIMSWILLAIIYDQPEILKLLLKLKVTIPKYIIKSYNLLDIANCLGHSECSDILDCYGIEETKHRQDSPFIVMFKIARILRQPEIADILLQKVWLRKPVPQRKEQCKSLVVDPETYKHGYGLRTLLDIYGDIEVKGSDGLTPLALAMKHSASPRAILDVLYFNPILTGLKENVCTPQTEENLFDRSNVKHITTLALTIERDLKTTWKQKWALCYPGLRTYEGSLAVLLLECGYDIRGDTLVRSSYTHLLKGDCKSAREREIRKKILDKIDRELYHPKPLKDCCRIFLRRKYPGSLLHMIAKKVLMPNHVKDFILMESRLKQRYDDNFSVVFIE